MSIPVRTLSALVSQAAVAAGYPAEVEPVVATSNPAHGDYQSNAAFRIAKAARTAPRVVAQALLDKLPAHPAVRKAELAGAGFINFHLDDAWLGAAVAEQADAPRLGLTERKGTVVIDYSSPNVAKRMHVGHLRSTVIGNALDRMMRYAGYSVIADNHIGDWGTQFGKLIVGWDEWLDAAAYEADPIGELERIYQKFAQEETPELNERARAETAKLQAGDARNRELWQRFITASMAEFDTIYQRLGVKFEVTYGESFYNDALQPMVDDLLERGIAQHSEGAVIIPMEPPMLIRKKDGAALYGTTDLATVRYRLDTWAPDRIVYVTDMRQQQHFQNLFKACSILGWTQAELVHVWFGMLSLPTGAMSTRHGTVVRLKDVLDEAVRRARAVVDQHSARIPEEERGPIAEAVGTAAVRYADLSQNPQSNVTFEWDKMLAMEGNTAPFVMYSHARARSIQRKGELLRTVQAFRPAHPLERELALALLRFPEAVDGALEGRPNLLCDYLFRTAQTFNRFYGELRVLEAEGDDAVARRSLVEAAARVLSTGLDLLGIKALERM